MTKKNWELPKKFREHYMKMFNKDKVLITDIYDSKSRLKELSRTVPLNKIILPDVLKCKNGSSI